MIRKSIEPGTKVFHEVYGFGTFKEWEKFDDDKHFAKIKFDEDHTHGLSVVPRKKLTEIDETL